MALALGQRARGQVLYYAVLADTRLGPYTATGLLHTAEVDDDIVVE